MQGMVDEDTCIPYCIYYLCYIQSPLLITYIYLLSKASPYAGLVIKALTFVGNSFSADALSIFRKAAKG